jgi:hypothetical protein
LIEANIQYVDVLEEHGLFQFADILLQFLTSFLFIIIKIYSITNLNLTELKFNYSNKTILTRHY